MKGIILSLLSRRLKLTCFAVYFCLVCLCVFATMLIGFFYTLESTRSEYSWGDVSYYNQLFYNSISGRLLQSSLYRSGGLAVSANPYPYIHSFATHINVTPFLFSLAYWFWPTVTGLYVIVISLNLLSFPFFSWKILKYFSPKTAFVKSVVATSLFVAGGFWDIISYKCHMSLFSGPFFLAAFYFFVANRRGLFWLTTILMCLISQDIAMVVLTFGLYILCCESERRSLSYLPIGFASLYLLIAVTIIQPAARYDLVSQHSSVVIASLARAYDTYLLGMSLPNLAFFLPLVEFTISAMLFTILWFGSIDRKNWLRGIKLAVIAPAPEILIYMVGGGPHHLMPVAVSCYCGVLLWFGHVSRTNGARKVSMARICLGILVGIALLAVNVKYSHFWRGSECLKKFFLVQPAVVQSTEKIFLSEKARVRASNRAVIQTVNSIPRNHSLVYWTNVTVDGFLSSRSDVWRFPDYFDLADFLVIQRDANSTFFRVALRPGQTIRSAIEAGTRHSSNSRETISEEVISKILEELVVNERTHRIFFNNQHQLILRRINKHDFRIQPTTVGLGWMRNVPLVISRYMDCLQQF